MKGQSDIYPPQRIIKSAGKTQIIYDVVVVEIEKEIMNDLKTIYEWDFVEIEGEITRAKIIDGIISKVHTKDAEIALINNELASPGTEEYANYQKLRTHAKEVAAEVVKNLE
jgi:hypothetical protein